MIRNCIFSIVFISSLSLSAFNPLELLHVEYITKKLKRFDAYTETFSILKKHAQSDSESQERIQYEQKLNQLIIDRFPYSQTPFTDYLQLLEQGYIDIRESKLKSPLFTHNYFDMLLYNIEQLFDYIIHTQNYADEQAWFIQPFVQTPLSSLYTSYKKHFIH